MAKKTIKCPFEIRRRLARQPGTLRQTAVTMIVDGLEEIQLKWDGVTVDDIDDRFVHLIQDKFKVVSHKYISLSFDIDEEIKDQIQTLADDLATSFTVVALYILLAQLPNDSYTQDRIVEIEALFDSRRFYAEKYSCVRVDAQTLGRPHASQNAPVDPVDADSNGLSADLEDLEEADDRLASIAPALKANSKGKMSKATRSKAAKPTPTDVVENLKGDLKGNGHRGLKKGEAKALVSKYGRR